MAETRKISIRKILQLFVTLVVTTGCIVAIVSASKIEDKKVLSGVAVHLRNDKKYHFIEENEILDLAINRRNINVEQTPIARLDLRGMERVILADPWVSDAQVFVDNERILHMYVTQRIPVARIFQQNGVSYYMDTTYSIMPLSRSYIYYTTVVTNVPELKNDSISWALRGQIVSLVRHLQADSFWNAQVSQVIVDSDGTFELQPMIGNQRIIFGDTHEMDQKLSNLFVFYKNVLNRIGWDKYETLDVRYKDQVVARPSLPYNGPVDKVVTNMNWINSIVETEAVIDVKDSVKAADKKAAQLAATKRKELERKVHKSAPVKAVKKVIAKADIKKGAKQPEKKTPAKQPDKKKAPAKQPDKKQQAKPADKKKIVVNTKDNSKKPAAPKPAQQDKKGQ